MAQSKFIQSVVKAAKGRPRSTEWFRDKIKEFGKPGAMDLIRDGKRDNAPFYGRLNMFFYDPKFKKTLPYYDTFPLVLPLEKYTDGFLGINLHYLPMNLRIRLLDRLVDYSNNTKFDESTRLAVDYSKLKNISFEAGVNNLFNEKYFTRRATGYPGPGIIPSAPQNSYLTIQIRL